MMIALKGYKGSSQDKPTKKSLKNLLTVPSRTDTLISSKTQWDEPKANNQYNKRK